MSLWSVLSSKLKNTSFQHKALVRKALKAGLGSVSLKIQGLRHCSCSLSLQSLKPEGKTECRYGGGGRGRVIMGSGGEVKTCRRFWYGRHVQKGGQREALGQLQDWQAAAVLPTRTKSVDFT